MLLQRLLFLILMSFSLLAGFSALMGEAKAQFFWEKIEAEQRRREAAQQAPAKPQQQSRQRQVQAPEPKPRGLLNNIEFEPKNAQREGEYLERNRPRQVQRNQRRIEPEQAQRQQIAPGIPQTAYREQDVRPKSGGGFLDWLFNAPKEASARPLPEGEGEAPLKVFVDPDVADRMNNGTRMVCVRTCDGAFMPISTGRNGASDRNNEICEAQCPGAQMKVFRMVGDQIENSMSQDGERYMSLANALKFRNSFDKTCSCRPQGKSWAEFASGMDDPTMRKGDSVLTTEQARRMSIAPTLRNASLREAIVEPVAKEIVEQPLTSAQSPIRVISIAPTRAPTNESEPAQPNNSLNPVEKLLLERNIKRHTPVKNGLVEANEKRG